MSSTLLRRPLAGLALTGTLAVGVMALGLKLVGNENLRVQLGSFLTPLFFFVLVVALAGLAVKMGKQLSRSRG